MFGFSRALRSACRMLRLRPWSPGVYAVKNYANGKSWRHGILDWRIPRRYVFNFRALFLKRSCGKDFCKTLRGGDLKGCSCETFLKDAFGRQLCGTCLLSSIDRTYAQNQDTELAWKDPGAGVGRCSCRSVTDVNPWKSSWKGMFDKSTVQIVDDVNLCSVSLPFNPSVVLHFWWLEGRESEKTWCLEIASADKQLRMLC